MISPFTIYLIGICDSLSGLFFSLGVIATACVMFIIVKCIDDLELGVKTVDNEKVNKRTNEIKYLIKCAIIFYVLHALMPSTKLAASMIVIPAIANNEKIVEIGSNSLDFLHELSKTWLIELKEEKE